MKYTIFEMILSVLVAAGVPSTVFGVISHRFAKRQGDREESWIEGMTSVLETSNANYHLARECGKAVVKLDPERRARNGELDAALQYAQDANHKQQEYLRREAAKRHG
jgi:hypothetical protein